MKNIELKQVYEETIAVIESRQRSVRSQENEQDPCIQGYLIALNDLRCFYITAPLKHEIEGVAIRLSESLANIDRLLDAED